MAQKARLPTKMPAITSFQSCFFRKILEYNIAQDTKVTSNEINILLKNKIKPMHK